jgi:methionyl-tRNA synthetase
MISMTEIPFSEFQKLDLRIGKIISVEDVEGADKLYKIKVDFGNEERIAVAGLKNYYSPDDLIDKKFVFILNLERRKIRGIESECMIFAADDGKNISLLQPDKDMKEGSKIR